MSADSGLGEIRFGDDGLLYRLAHRLRLLDPDGRRLRLSIAIAAFTWLPLLVLTLMERPAAEGPTIGFVHSYGTHARFLLTIPLLFLSETLFSRRLRDVLRRMLQAHLVSPDDMPRFSLAWHRAHRAWNSWRLELMIAALTLIAMGVGLRSDLPAGLSTWRTGATGTLSLAGWWYTLLSLPIFQFLFWRWCFRLLVWSLLLWRMSRLSLQLLPTHPDSAGGLGSLGVAQVDLAPMTFGLSAMLAASFAEQLAFGGTPLASLAVPIAAVVIGTTVVLVAPLAFFARRLLEVKQRGLLEYGALATSYVRAFDLKWLRGQRAGDEPFLGTADLQSLADLGNSFSVIDQMSLLPILPRQILLLTLSTALPMLSLLLIVFPLDKLIIDIVKSVVGI